MLHKLPISWSGCFSSLSFFLDVPLSSFLNKKNFADPKKMTNLLETISKDKVNRTSTMFYISLYLSRMIDARTHTKELTSQTLQSGNWQECAGRSTVSFKLHGKNPNFSPEAVYSKGCCYLVNDWCRKVQIECSWVHQKKIVSRKNY